MKRTSYTLRDMYSYDIGHVSCPLTLFAYVGRNAPSITLTDFLRMLLEPSDFVVLRCSCLTIKPLVLMHESSA